VEEWHFHRENCNLVRWLSTEACNSVLSTSKKSQIHLHDSERWPTAVWHSSTMLSAIHFLTSIDTSVHVSKFTRCSPPLLHTVIHQILEYRHPGNEANVMKHWENYVTCKVWKVIGVKLYSQLNNHHNMGEGFRINFRDLWNASWDKAGWYPPKLVKPCLAQALTWTSSILALQLAVDKFFIYYLVINLTSWSASSAAFTISAGVRLAAVGNLLIAVICIGSMVRRWRVYHFRLSHFDAIVATNSKLTTISLYSVCYTCYEFKAPPISCVGVARRILRVVENRPFYTFGLTATTSDRRLSTASNMGFVKQKAWCAPKPRIKSDALTALKWW